MYTEINLLLDKTSETFFNLAYQYTASVPTDATARKNCENNVKVINALLGSLIESEFVKVM